MKSNKINKIKNIIQKGFLLISEIIRHLINK